MSKRNHLTLKLFIVFALVVATGLPAYNAPVLADEPHSDSLDWTIAEPEGFVYYASNGEAICRPATAEEARAMNERDPDAPMWVITRKGLSPQVGEINIVLRGTAQLDSFPQARDGFLAAANRWIARLQSTVPITIIIDVDFGPTRFGTPFPSNVLGSTGTQALFNPAGYADVRNRLITGASAQEAALYNALPASPLPTDIGGVAGVTVPSAVLRALGAINPVANPASEQAQFGPPPSIGFNSNFAFDFNPDNGIDSDKIDFDGVAAHEIG
ncbi:MAG: NF038122 family metalloprotease, partial [Acidobacteriota bacterium]